MIIDTPEENRTKEQKTRLTETKEHINNWHTQQTAYQEILDLLESGKLPNTMVVVQDFSAMDTTNKCQSHQNLIIMTYQHPSTVSTIPVTPTNPINSTAPVTTPPVVSTNATTASVENRASLTSINDSGVTFPTNVSGIYYILINLILKYF